MWCDQGGCCLLLRVLGVAIPMFVLMITPTVKAIQQQEDMERCSVALATESQDDQLSREEYVTVVNKISGAPYFSSFASLPGILQTNFDALAAGGEIIDIHRARSDTTDDAGFVKEICLQTISAIQAGASGVTTAATNTDLSAAPTPFVYRAATAVDAQFTGVITIRNEFVISNSLNLGTEELHSESIEIGRLEIAFHNMVVSVIDRIDDFGIMLEPNSVAITDIVDTDCPNNAATGSRCHVILAEYRVSVFNEEEEVRRRELADLTMTFIQSGALQGELGLVDPESPLSIAGITETPMVTPTAAPSTIPGGVTPRPTRPLNQCYVGMIVSDESQDERLNRQEYVALVEFLGPGLYGNVQFESLPVPIIANFDELATNGSIAIAGLPQPNQEQSIILQQICAKTNAAITFACCGGPAEATVNPTTQPSAFFSSIPTAGPTASPTAGPTAGPSQSRYPTTKPATSSPTTAQWPSISPSMTMPSTNIVPSTSIRPSVTMRMTEIVHQFVVSNSMGVTAQDFNTLDNPMRIQLDNAYDLLVERVMDETVFAMARESVEPGERKLLVNYAGGSTKYYVDSPCPQGASGDALCQEVVALFSLGVSQDEDPARIVATAKEAVARKIDTGDLQALLTQDGSAIVVEEGATIVHQPSSLPSLSPSTTLSSALPSTLPSMIPSNQQMTTTFPTRSSSVAPIKAPSASVTRSSGRGLSTPALVGFLTGGAVLLFILLGIISRMCRKKGADRSVIDDEGDYGPNYGLEEYRPKVHGNSSNGSSGSTSSQDAT